MAMSNKHKKMSFLNTLKVLSRVKWRMLADILLGFKGVIYILDK